MHDMHMYAYWFLEVDALNSMIFILFQNNLFSLEYENLKFKRCFNRSPIF